MLLVTNRTVTSDVDDCCKRVSQLAPVPSPRRSIASSAGEGLRRTEEGEEVEDDRRGHGLWCRFLPSGKAVLSGFSYTQTAATGGQREETEGVAQRDSEMAPKAERSEESGQSL